MLNNRFLIKNFLFQVFLLSALCFSITGQDLSSILQNEVDKEKETILTEGTFKTTRVVLNQSVENVPRGELIFLISHHFGSIKGGVSDFFGLDQASIRLGFEYGLVDRFSLGIGRSSYEKTIDGFVKIQLLRQQSGASNMPIAVTWFSNIAVISSQWSDPERDNLISGMVFWSAIIIAIIGILMIFLFQDVLIKRREAKKGVLKPLQRGEERIKGELTKRFALYTLLFLSLIVIIFAFFYGVFTDIIELAMG